MACANSSPHSATTRTSHLRLSIGHPGAVKFVTDAINRDCNSAMKNLHAEPPVMQKILQRYPLHHRENHLQNLSFFIAMKIATHFL